MRTKHGFTILLEPKDYIAWAIIMGGHFEPWTGSVLTTLLQPNDLFVDVGANFGWFSLLAAARLKSIGGRIVAYEPQPRLCRLLESSARLNGFDHLVVRQAAVADFHGRAALRPLAPDRPEFMQVRRTESASAPVELVSLDSELAYTPPTVVKIDAEGLELRVLRGMQALLDSSSLRCIFLEVHPPLMAALGDDPDTPIQMLRARGFRLHMLPPVTRAVALSELPPMPQSAPRAPCYNVLARRG